MKQDKPGSSFFIDEGVVFRMTSGLAGAFRHGIGKIGRDSVILKTFKGLAAVLRENTESNFFVFLIAFAAVAALLILSFFKEIPVISVFFAVFILIIFRMLRRL